MPFGCMSMNGSRQVARFADDFGDKYQSILNREINIETIYLVLYNELMNAKDAFNLSKLLKRKLKEHAMVR